MRPSKRSSSATASPIAGPLLSMTHSARAAIAASVISPREGTPVLDEPFEDLCRPDHGNAGGFADPQDLFLHFRHALETELRREIAARDHHAERPARHGAGDQIRQILHRIGPLDLGHETQRRIRAGIAGERGIEQIDVFRAADEGIADHVGTGDDGGDIRLVLGRERRQPEAGIRAVEALFRLDPAAFRPGPDDPDDRFAVFGMPPRSRRSCRHRRRPGRQHAAA